jgi:hypothetical protein
MKLYWLPAMQVMYKVVLVYLQVEPIHLFGADDQNKLPYNQLPLQPLQAAKKADEDADIAASILPVNIANGSINISMGKAMAGFSSQAANFPKMASISPSVSLPKLQPNGTAAAAAAAAASATSTGMATPTAASTSTASAAAAAGASSAAMGDAVSQVTSGLWGMMNQMKDAAASVTPATAMFTPTTTSAPTATTAGNHYQQAQQQPQFQPQLQQQLQQQQQQQPQPQQQQQEEVKLPDGQRLAYRMDYMLKESGNTYIQAITSHTAYWGNSVCIIIHIC